MIVRKLQSLLVVSLLVLVGAGCASAQEARFSSPQAAADSLVAAVRSNNTSKLKEIFGPDSDQILSSGDPVADSADASRFVKAYEEAHRFQKQTDGQQILLVGKEDWPFPVPVVEVEGKYVFDSEAGKEEILNRRVGRNELSATQVCLAIVDAQRDYVKQKPMGGDIPIYASKLVSTPGTKDGLYWPVAEKEPASPLGELVAAAAAEGYGVNRAAGETPPPYHGYRYRLLTAQGPNAQGGAMDYIVNGKLIGGFAAIAYPAQYGNSGIMTFITSHDGVVYQRDLGPETETIAKSMSTFDPSPQWTRVSDPTTATAGN